MQIYRKCRAVSYLEILFNVAIKIVLSNHYTKGLPLKKSHKVGFLYEPPRWTRLDNPFKIPFLQKVLKS